MGKVKEYDRNRKQKDKEEGKIKRISDMSNREKRVQRKKLREASKCRKHKEALKMRNILLRKTHLRVPLHFYFLKEAVKAVK